ncbi:15461_t:CDS:2 [Entrophospora sp. SA101]|nr:15461_t:CDS:2 [Entrophospora sp. SA101]
MLQNLGHLSQQDLLIKLVKKEEEVQNLLGELQTLSQTLAPEFSYEPAYRKKFLDPAINALFRTMKMELEEKDKTIENLKRELDGVGFTPNSITGKKLVEKLRTLQNENEELGRQLRQGRVEQYEVEIALQRKKNFSAFKVFVIGIAGEEILLFFKADGELMVLVFIRVVNDFVGVEDNFGNAVVKL